MIELKAHRILAIVGPTASGKTALSLLLAESLGGEIVSADSRQIYKHLDIGTAKPSKADQSRILHHFIDVLEPTVEYSAGQYGLDARKVMAEIQHRRSATILVGGSGLYLKAVIDGIGNVPAAKQEIRSELEDEHKRLGLGHLVEELGKVDGQTLEAMKQMNARRVIRALEVFRSSGIPLSKLHAEQAKNLSLNVFQVAVRRSRPDLHDRIRKRVDEMLQEGLIDETRRLLAQGYPRALNSLNTVGYKEVCDYLEGKMTQDEMVEAIKRNTRRFAKRQMTWFRADKRIHWIDAIPGSQPEEIAPAIERVFRESIEGGM